MLLSRTPVTPFSIYYLPAHNRRHTAFVAFFSSAYAIAVADGAAAVAAIPIALECNLLRMEIGFISRKIAFQCFGAFFFLMLFFLSVVLLFGKFFFFCLNRLS